MEKVRVRLRPMVSRANLPTVIKTAVLPGDRIESLMIATQVGEIFYLRNGVIGTFLDIRSRVLKLGAFGEYDERGLLGIAFHPDFTNNGLFYLHYSVADTQGPGALPNSYSPNPCNPETLHLEWLDRENKYDHIDTVEEWVMQSQQQLTKRKTLLNLRRPFFNHNGVNSLNFSPETGRLVLTTGDGGSGYDPFDLAQIDMEIAGKIIEIDVYKNTFYNDSPVVSRFNELPVSIQEMLTVTSKGVRNAPGITYQSRNNRYIKYVGNVGQHLVESIFSYIYFRPIPVTQLVQAYSNNSVVNREGLINLGWRGWEGDLPSLIISDCPTNSNLQEKIIAFYEDAITTSTKRLLPLTCYYHTDPRPDKFAGTALTGVQAYLGEEIPALYGCVVFTDFVQRRTSPARGVLAYSRVRPECMVNDYSIIDVDYNFQANAAYYTCLGTNLDQTSLYLGVYGSRNVTDLNLGSIFEIVS